MSTSSNETSRHRSVIRDLLVFQVKLWLEGFKDVVLVPISLGAALVDLVFRRSERKGTLYSVMKMGKRFEQWVDLYAALEARPPTEESTHRIRSLDDLLNEATNGIANKAPSMDSNTADTSRQRG